MTRPTSRDEGGLFEILAPAKPARLKELN